MDHTKYGDSEFEERFFACDMAPELFTHEAHLRLGWLLIRRHGKDRAEELLCKGIERFDRVFGDGTKFDRTITIVSVRILAQFMEGSASDEFALFISEFPRLRTHFRELLDTH